MFGESFHNVAVLVLTAAQLAVDVLFRLIPRRAKAKGPCAATGRQALDPQKVSYKIHASNGVPSFQQLTGDLDLDPKRLGVAERLYETGLLQYDRPVNNREGVLEESRREMARLASSLSAMEVAQAERIGVELATAASDRRKMLQREYRELPPQVQTYAQHKRREYEVQLTINRDLEKGIPRTDYTRVKTLIASGYMSLEEITSQLPRPWQDPRSLHRQFERPKPAGHVPKRVFVPAVFMTETQGMLEDKRAERDGNWVISRKHDLKAPYQRLTTVYRWVDAGRLPIPVGQEMLVSHPPSSEWETEFWGKDGHLDQTYLRAKSGQDPRATS